MNLLMLKTELRKIFCRRVVWVSMALFLALFLALKLQFIAKPGVVYTLEPMRAPLARLAEQEEFRAFVRGSGYNCGREDLEPFLPPEVLEYIEGFRGSERVFRSLNSELVRILNNYCERRDDREAHIRLLAEEAAGGGTGPLARAKQKLLARYLRGPAALELNLETSANNFIDINHAVVFPGTVILVILVGLAGSFSDEYACGAASGLLTTRRGRAGVFFAKALAALIFVLFVVLGMQGFFFLVTAVCHHAPGRALTAASTYGLALTPYAGSVWGFCLRQLAGNLLAGLAMASLTLCLSAFSRNALLPFFAAGLFYGGTALWGNMMPFPAYLSTPLSLPGELSPFLLQTQVELMASGHYTSLFGLVVPTLALSAVLHLLAAAGLLILCFLAYTRKQVKD